MMFKNVKRVACLALAMILSVAFILPSAANASPVSSDKLLPSEKAVYSFTGAESAAKLSSRMESYGVQVEDDTLFQVVESEANLDAATLVVTNTNGSEISQDMFMVLDDKGDVVPMPVSVGGQTRGINDGFGDDIDDIFSDGSFVFRWAVLYDYQAISHGRYLRPKHAQFVCLYNASAGYSVTDAYMNLSTNGVKCDSNFNALEKDPNTWHEIIINQAVVARNTYYAKTQEYDANGWICISHFNVRIEFWLNGRRYWKMVELDNFLFNG